MAFYHPKHLVLFGLSDKWLQLHHTTSRASHNCPCQFCIPFLRNGSAVFLGILAIHQMEICFHFYPDVYNRSCSNAEIFSNYISWRRHQRHLENHVLQCAWLFSTRCSRRHCDIPKGSGISTKFRCWYNLSPGIFPSRGNRQKEKSLLPSTNI